VFLGSVVASEFDLEASQTRELLRRKGRDASRGSPGSFVRAKNALSQDDKSSLALPIFLGELMGRWGGKVFANYKRRGEWVELLFMTVASGLGFTVAKPWGDSARYDVIVENEGRFLRIQVKSTEQWAGSGYVCQLHMCGRLYTAKDIDYFAIYVLALDLWYIFPARTLAGLGAVVLTPHRKGHKYERYMENWWLLTRHHFRRGTRTVVPPEVGRPGSVDRLSARIVERIRGMGKGE
jgi:PD-(D/E)XK endonuclease